MTKWSQVRSGWPDEDIRLYAPGVDSGASDYFTETVTGYIPFPDTIYNLAMNKCRSGATGPAFGGDDRMIGTIEEALRASS